MIYGEILDVHTDTVGELLTADAAAAATVLSVVDARTFREEGGLIQIGQYVYTYTALDLDLNTITISGGLSVAAVADTLVQVYPEAQVKRAFVDLGIEGDAEGVWATVPQSMVLTLPDGLRYEGQREIVALEERGPGDLVLVDVGASANVASTTVLDEGSVETHSLTVGVTGNLVQDPDFNRDYWSSPPRSFTVAGPDTVYTESKFVRSIGDSGSNTGFGPGEDSSTWSWWLTDLIPVDPGRPVRISALARRDAASLAGGSGQARVRLVFYKADQTTATSDDATMVGTLILATDMVADTWTPISVTATAPEGYTYVKAGVQQRLQTAGFVDFIKPEVQILWSRVQSADYVDGQVGWNFDSGQSQVENLNVLGAVGAGTVAAQELTLGGQDLQDDILTPLPLGMVAFDSGSGGKSSGQINSSTELIGFSFTFGPLKAGRIYRFLVNFHLSTSVAGDRFDCRLHYTTNGATPTVSDTTLSGSLIVLVANSTGFVPGLIVGYYQAPTDIATMKIILTANRSTGTGFGRFYNDTLRRPQFSVDDCGIYATAALAGTLAQKSYDDGSPATPDPPSTYVTSWLATWGRSYDATLATYPGDPTTLYQGYLSSLRGNTRSLVGFDYAAIQTALSGATISKVTLTYRVQTVYRQFVTLYIGSHTYTTKPSTWASGNVTPQRWSFPSQVEGGTYTQDITAIGTELKLGTARGIAIGPHPSDSPQGWGGLYGDITDAARPKLTITYTK